MDEDDLQRDLKLKGRPGRWISGRIINGLEINKINRLQEKFGDLSGPELATRILEDIGVSYEILPEQLLHIPEEGGFITVSNHPFGSIDGLILNAAVGARRPDYKILTTFLLSRIPGLKDGFLPVDNFSSRVTARSVQGIRQTLSHITEGKGLGLFPAGEVSTVQKKKARTALGKERVIEDKPWADSISKLIRKSELPVIPIYFEGTNSPSFHRLGRIHPRFRTLRLVHEMFNKSGLTVRVRIGQPIPFSEIAEMEDPAIGSYLRNRCYALQGQLSEAEGHKEEVYSVPVAAPVEPALVRADMERISDRILFESGPYRCYLTKADDIPSAMRELARLREETFRGVGEGTGQAEDTDEYDKYYHHLILWHIGDGAIAGAYRIGFGSEVVASHGGVSGFYTSSLFRFQKGSEKLLSHCLELGRTIIVGKYQRDILPLKLLFSGLIAAASTDPEARYFFGPVSISNDVPLFYKSLIVRHIERTFPFPGGEKVALPRTPFEPDFLRVNPDVILPKEGGIERLNRLLVTLSEGKYRLPVLVRKYFSWSARVVCFNVDPLFCNSLDGLILVRLADIPKSTLASLTEIIPDGKKVMDDLLAQDLV